ncbi:uncharacterized protein BXZ73DRAFT_97743 [Epithele typhae]|uniref:uncharacterized protein n=1 Tax=Epithele typhae TaxID=378194 RepID=UPI002008A987|nr:uncharacterized protein BXZ73DRAFT_97743 [Epithele typhae]KAH9942329.1 hypothetical protein BXZ73DRAFT_97743 [Epithele typhae]
MALGYLERSQRPLPTPILSATAPLVQVDPRLVLRAIIAQEARDLDMDLWNRAIQEQEDVSRRDTSNGQNGDPATEHDGKN